MKILDAKQADGGICVEYEMLGETHKLSYPLDTSDKEIKSHLKELEKGRKKRAELQEKHKERLELESRASETCNSLTK